MPHTIKIQHASNCIQFSKYCTIAIIATVITVQVNNITVSKMHLGRFSCGMLNYIDILILGTGFDTYLSGI